MLPANPIAVLVILAAAVLLYSGFICLRNAIRRLIEEMRK